MEIKIMNRDSNSDSISRDEVNEMIENALRRHNRRSTIISSVLGWILIGGYSFGLFQAVPVSYTHLTLPTTPYV